MLLLSTLSAGATAQAVRGPNPSADPLEACDFKAADIPGREFRLDKSEDHLRGAPAVNAQVARRLESIRQALSATWPGQKGFEALFYRTMAPDTSRPFSYHLQTTLYTYRCVVNYDKALKRYVHTGKIRKPNLDSMRDLSVEAIHISIGVNSKKDLFAEEMFAHVDGKKVRIDQFFHVAGDIDGCKLFGGGPGLNYRRTVLIARPNENPFITLTRGQYVNAMLEFYDQEYGTASHPGTSKSFSRSTIEWQRADMRRYLQTAGESELSLPARPPLLGYWRDRNYDTSPLFDDGSKGYGEVVMVNPKYFRRDIPTYVPQIMVMSWKQASIDQVSRILDQRLMANFPARRLQMLLGK